MSAAPGPGGVPGAGAGVVAGGVGGVAGAGGWAGWRRRLRFLGFLCFLGFGLTGAVGGRTADGEMPPVGLGDVLVEGDLLPDLGAVPPEELLPDGPLPEVPDDAVVPPVAADAVVDAQASASISSATASVRRNSLIPCMDMGSDRLRRPLREVSQIWPCSPPPARGNK
jgi:hypothetical protein